MLVLGWAIAGLVGAVAGVLVAPFRLVADEFRHLPRLRVHRCRHRWSGQPRRGCRIRYRYRVGHRARVRIQRFQQRAFGRLGALGLNLLFKPEGVFSHHKARAV
jgi:hypothetical protein